MTKFEEEAIKEAEKSGYVMAKSKIVFYEDEKGITFVDFNGTHTNFNFPWLEFAKNWHSDEEFQEHFIANKNLIDVNTKLAEEIANLKSQLQQQALPVVPEFVAEWYEEHKDDLDFSIFEACVNLHDDCSSDFEKWFGNSENKSIETLVRMKDGYTVEKPQLFYLKHIDMSKADKECDWYLITDCVKLCHEWVGKNLKPKDDDFKFTQQEIGSMQTGSYEQIEVEK